MHLVDCEYQLKRGISSNYYSFTYIKNASVFWFFFLFIREKVDFFYNNLLFNLYLGVEYLFPECDKNETLAIGIEIRELESNGNI